MPDLEIIKTLSLTTLAFVLAIILTPFWTHFLYKYKLVKSIRNEGHTPVFSRMHKKKSGTPTMGGVLIWLTVLILALAFFWVGKFWLDFFFCNFDFIFWG